MKTKDISVNLTDQKYRWWLDWSNCVFLAILAIVLAFQSLVTYLLNRYSIYPYVGYWTCYWWIGMIDTIVLSGWFLLEALGQNERSMKIAACIYRDLYCPLVGIGLALIGVAYAIVGFFSFFILLDILGASFFLMASIVLIGLTMTLQSMGQEMWTRMSLYTLILVIALYGVTSVIESMIDHRSHKMKRN